jgi:membrane protein
MKQLFKTSKKVVVGVYEDFTANDPVVYSAAIAFFTIFSMPSILFIIVAILEKIPRVEQSAIQETLSEQTGDLIGQKSSEQIESLLQAAMLTEQGFLNTLTSIIILFISATAVFNFIQQGLNNIWEVKPKPKKGFLKFLKDRALSFGLIVVLGFLMLVFLIKDAVFGFFQNVINNLVSSITSEVMTVANFLLSFSVTMLIFTLLFKVLPDAKIKWRDALVGSFATAILFTIGKYVIGILLNNMKITNAYDAAGSLVGILVWVFYSSIIVMIGGIFTKVYANRYGKEIKPTSTSVRIEKREIEKEG